MSKSKYSVVKHYSVVKCFKASDGSLHDTEAGVVTTQFKIDLRGIMQSDGAGQGQFTSTAMAEIVARNVEKIYPLTQKYRQDIIRISKRKQ